MKKVVLAVMVLVLLAGTVNAHAQVFVIMNKDVFTVHRPSATTIWVSGEKNKILEVWKERKNNYIKVFIDIYILQESCDSCDNFDIYVVSRLRKKFAEVEEIEKNITDWVQGKWDNPIIYNPVIKALSAQ